MLFQIIARLSGGRTKTIINRDETSVLQTVVIPFLKNGVLQDHWGNKKISYQVLEVEIYGTIDKFDKKSGKPLDKFIKGCKNRYKTFEKKAQSILNVHAEKVFIVMPIQGKKTGSQEDQRIFSEFTKRFETIEKVLQDFNCVAIRIDREYAIKNLAERIRTEIEVAKFLIADLTDERPSCYYEVGYGEALKKPVIYLASEFSVINTKEKTKIHFDVHHNINFFSNHKELRSKLKSAIDKNKKELFQ